MPGSGGQADTECNAITSSENQQLNVEDWDAKKPTRVGRQSSTILSHVDGAMGMARGAEEDSADSQWYITDTDQHGLDPENRDDGGYAVFGIVRDGMKYVREIASTPTVTNPAPDNFANPGPDLLGRPIREVHIDSMRMLGVADPDGTIRFILI